MPEKSPTPDPVEIVERGTDAASQGDIDGSLAPFPYDVVWDISSVGMGAFRGDEEIRAFFEDWTGTYEDFAIALKNLERLAEGRG